MGLGSLLERIAKVRVKDCFQFNDVVYFIVSPGETGKALGKDNRNIKRIQDQLQKRVRIIEFRSNVEEFVKRVIYPLRPEKIKEVEKDVIIEDPSKKTKSLLIGRDGKNLQLINRAVKRFFDVEVKVE